MIFPCRGGGRPFVRGAWRASSQVCLPGTACCAPTEQRQRSHRDGGEGEGFG
jgi:hypothetical protein